MLVLLLAGLAYAIATCSAAALATRLRAEKARHDLLVQSKRRRQECFASTRNEHPDVVLDGDEHHERH